MKPVLVDIDEVLANSRWRNDLIDVSWDEFHAASVNDAAVQPIKCLINNLPNVILLTGRPEKWRQLTTAWLVHHHINVDELLMRPENDYRTAPLVKIDLVKERFGDDFATKIAFLMDDREDICSSFSALGLITFHVRLP